MHSNSKDKIFNYVFAHRNDDKEIFPLTVEEIAKAQVTDKLIQKDKDKYENKLVENIDVLCKEGRLVIPKKLQYRAIAWYHHYLQHPGHTRLEETLKQAMYCSHDMTRVTLRNPWIRTVRESVQVDSHGSLRWRKRILI
jgi:hypothetical protein